MLRNTLTGNDKYPVRDCENLSSPIQMELSINPKKFSDSFVRFWNFDLILSILEKKMIVIATLFRKLETVKDFVTPLSKKHTFRALFYSQHVRGSQTLVKSAWEHFIFFFFHDSERNWLGNYLPYWYVKSYGCFVTHWLAMRSIPFGIVRISRPRLKWNYL